MQPPGKVGGGGGGKKIYTFGSGHMTKMATMSIYGKNLQKPLCMPICVTGYQFNGQSGPG